jgi:pyrroloquinoline quinone biosynthesis protein B
VLLTNADLDHVLGAFLLREGGPLNLYASAAVRYTVEQHLGLTRILEPFCGAAWHEPPFGEFAPLSARNAKQTLLYRAIPLRATPPAFAKAGSAEAVHSVAYQFLNPRTNRRLLVAPDVAEISAELSAALANSDAVLFDGTFWSTDELAQVRPGARTAKDMGHVTIRDGSLKVLAGLAARHKVYIHINNTNPVLSPESPERAAVEAAGIVVGYDGMEFEL